MIALRTLPRHSAASIALVFARPSGATGKLEPAPAQWAALPAAMRGA